MRKTLKFLTAALSLVVPFGVAFAVGTAFAASDPTAAQYHHDPAAAVVHAANTGGGLPYTGMDLLALAGVAALLVAFGIALVKTSRPREER